tara:strand:- start:140 stop:574 length:435 start_codon:yes stop_codon:yes gene_type:complete
MPIKSFRGRIADGEVQSINLHTNNGMTGYKITKFQLLPIDSNETVEQSVKIYSIPQTTATEDINFADNTLLAAGIVHANADRDFVSPDTVIFDNMVFNQDIFITSKAGSSARDVNYYIELEQVKLDLSENTVATLKDIRNIEAQ